MKKFLMVLAVMGVLALAPTAKAACAGDLVVLGTDNIPNATLTVTFCKVGNTFTLVSIDTNLAGTPKVFSLHWQNAGANLDTTQGGGDGIGGNTGAWSTKDCPPGPGNCKADGFGANADWGSEASNPGGDVTALTFYFTGDPGYLGIHVGGFDGGCSGWATNGPFTGDAGSAVSTDCLQRRVPEPGTLMLLGAGLVGLAAIRRRMAK